MMRFPIPLAATIAISTLAHAQDGVPGSQPDEGRVDVKQQEIDVSGEWRSLKAGSIIQLEKSVKSLSGKRDNGKGYAVTYELTQQSDGSYSGLAAEEFSCYQDHFCYTETPIEISKIDESRIEGRRFGVDPPKGFLRGMRYCDSCGKSEEKNARWMDFVWVREADQAP